MRPGPPLWAAMALLLWAALAAAADPPLTISGANPKLAEHIREVAAEAAPRLEAWTGSRPGRIAIDVFSDKGDFIQRMHAIGAPAWADGLAQPASGTISIKAPGLLGGVSPFDHVLVHELMHIYLAGAMDGHPLPLWLEEGLAMVLSGEAGGRAQAMAMGVLAETLPELSELAQGFPPEESAAARAYALSYYFTGWFLTTHGDGAMRTVLAGLARGLVPTAAFRRATGRTLGSLESEFRAEMEDRFSWVVFLTSQGVLWGLLALVAALGLVASWRKQRDKRRSMDEQDRDYGAPGPSGQWPPEMCPADIRWQLCGPRPPSDARPGGRKTGFPASLP